MTTKLSKETVQRITAGCMKQGAKYGLPKSSSKKNSKKKSK